MRAAFFIFLLPLLACQGAVIVLSTDQNEFVPGTFNQGWYSDVSPNLNSNDNYTVGRGYPFGTSQAMNYRNYFTFSLPTISEPISSVTLTLQRFLGGGSVTYSLFQVSTAATALNTGKSTLNLNTYNDLGDGISYGSYPGPYAADNFYDLLTFSLNSSAISTITSSLGGYFSIGGSLTDGLITGQDQVLFSGSSANPTAGTSGYAATLTIVTVPEPTSFALLLLATPLVLRLMRLTRRCS
jgi:hypothetical protein